MVDPTAPEPTERDEHLALAFLRLRDATALRGDAAGEARCRTCRFFADPAEDLAGCHHADVAIVVGAGWRCDRWTAAGDADVGPPATDRRRADGLLAHGWQAHPRGDQRCSRCRYYLEPGDSVSYCWHPGLQVGVGHDHWCPSWAPIPGDR